MNRRLFLSTAATATAAAYLLPGSARAQDPTDENIETADGVKLRGIFYKAANSKNGSCVILLHEPFTDPTKGDWDGLAKTLAGKGYHTLRFDFRGHGKSKDVIPDKFWKDAFNADLSAAGKNPPKKTIEEKDFKGKSAYYPKLVYDIAAARNHLDKLNDDGQVNTSSTYIIGAGEAATLGMLFLTTEWHREQKKPMLALGIRKPAVSTGAIANGSSPAGRDYGGAVWLTPRKMQGFSSGAIENWVSRFGRDNNGDLRRETPMLFVYGEKDAAGVKESKFFFDQVMVAKGKPGSKIEPLDNTFLRERKGTNLAGVNLLGKDDTLGTEKMIVEFLDKMEEKRRKVPRITRDYTEPLAIYLNQFGTNSGG